MSRPRDTQRQRLYDSEGHSQGPSRLARLLHEGARVESTGSVAISACQAYVDAVLALAPVQRRWGQRTLTVRHKVYGNATASFYGDWISLPPWARVESTILHEIAHHLTPNGYAAHGPEFAGVLLFLTRHVFGADAATEVRSRFRAGRVRHNTKGIPAPVERVVTAAERNAAATAAKRQQRAVEDRRRVAARVQESRPLATGEGAQAAVLIRRAVKAGTFGPSGSKPRAHALATARALDTAGSR